MQIRLVLCSALALLSACGGEVKKERPAALVEARTVGQMSFADKIEAVGTALGNEQVTLSAPVTERIVSIHFSDGGYVSKGQVMARMAIAEESGELAAAQARETEANQQLQRIQALKNRGFATNASLDTQVATLNQARATAQQARAAIADRVIRAPFSGWASLRTVSPGAIVTAGTEIAMVSDISRIKLDFTVPETQLGLLRAGMPIMAVAAAYPGRNFAGTIATIDPVVDPATRAVKIRAIMPNGDRSLKPGMLMTVRIGAHPRTSTAVPELAVVADGEQNFVFVVTEGNKVKKSAVTTGVHDDGMIEILSGLSPGQKVVTDGVVKLTDGMPVKLAGAGKAGQDQPSAAN